MTGSAHITIQINLGDVPALHSAIRKRIKDFEAYVAQPHIDRTEALLTLDIVASLQRSLSAIDEQAGVIA